ncbi:MAG: type II toxin-antitoxin system HipA family toxin [Deltaproteobacteria bacterium]|nr:type II toxin-antitoxin system HipA family toxin [Myxococcales bacterium]MDP3218521.1 type II toxin-antitoxin system HipA family toxin [Deltaproteobacteria bacterium]
MKGARRSVEVWADWDGLSSIARVGELHAVSSRGREVFSFEYDPAWLHSGSALSLDPDLGLYPGPQYAAGERANFGVFLDSSPDRWGRVLLDRREALLAREEGRRVRPLLELDYLLGVYDGHRMGALRFRRGEGPYLDDNRELAAPPWASLRELEHASLELERDDVEDDPSYARWLRLLIAPGSSLGGARPKAGVVAVDGALWIAKFPSRDDTHDVGAWEGVLHRLARRAGVVTAEARVERFGHRHHTFLAKRFDRAGSGARVHFASAMTLTAHLDGEPASYLELAEVLARQGAHPARDLEQLWRRIIFSMCVSNVDDHLRNHGFLLDPRGAGWALSPAYDLNPVARSDGLVLNVSETDNAQDLDLARSVAEHFRLKPSRATAIVDEVVASSRTWREEAATVGISRAQQERMANAFRLVTR